MSSVDYKILCGLTPSYFYNGRNRTASAYQEGKIKFETPLDRVKAELYGLSIIAVQFFLFMTEAENPKDKGVQKYSKAEEQLKKILGNQISDMKKETPEKIQNFFHEKCKKYPRVKLLLDLMQLMWQEDYEGIDVLEQKVEEIKKTLIKKTTFGI